MVALTIFFLMKLIKYEIDIVFIESAISNVAQSITKRVQFNVRVFYFVF